MNKLLRVKSKQDFQEVINKKRKISSNSFVIYYLKNNLDFNRFGISASKKIGGAVIRVKVRRQIRSMIDYILKNVEISSTKCDYVIIVRTQYLKNDYQKNLKELIYLINKVGGKN